MAAYGAAISLKNTIEYILHSSHCTLVEPSEDIIQLAYDVLQPLQEILERLDSTRKSRSRKVVNAWDGLIKETIWEFEDKLDSILTDQILSQFQSRYNGVGGERDELLFTIDLTCLQDDVDSFILTLKRMEKTYISCLQQMAEVPFSSRIGFGGTKCEMVGLRDQFRQVKRNLMREFLGARVYSLIGMPGVGKTTLALEIFEDPEIMEKYECRAWVTAGRNPQLSGGSASHIYRVADGDGRLDGFLTETLEGKCLLVLDDVWEIEVLESLLWSITVSQIQYIQILVTARDRNVIANIASNMCSYTEVVRFLNEEESKELLCNKVFGGKEHCPPQLDKALTKIAKKCEGLPLMIVKVADILSKSQNTEPDYWEDVAEERNSVFTDAYNEISEVLFPSYDYLP